MSSEERFGSAPIRSPREIAARWIAAWGGGAAIGIANGMAREATFGRRLEKRTANQISALSGIGAFAVFFWRLQRRWPIAKNSDTLRIGAAWLALTVVFEFGFGRLAAKKSWRSLIDEYDLRKGRAWPLVLAWIATGPAVVRGLQRELRRR
jgi:hypothetical protein